nr:MAG TPA: hypothetical protein [Bacteriophage sp.]
MPLKKNKKNFFSIDILKNQCSAIVFDKSPF